jgi:pilus assembly protein CpaE
VSRDGLETAQMIAQLRPDVALVHAHMPGMEGYEACRLGALASPQTSCVIISADGANEAEVREKAMRAGARAVVGASTDAVALADLVHELGVATPRPDDEVYRLIMDPSRMPVTIAVTGAKGGIGKTTLATNLALCMNRAFPKQVALVDFIGHYGDVSLLLDAPPSGGTLDLLEYQEIDSALLHSRMGEHDSGLRFLAGVNGPESVSAPSRATTHWVASLLGALRRDFRVIVFDVAPTVYPLSQYIFLRSTLIVVVAVLQDLSTLRDTGSLVRGLLAARIPPERIKLVANRRDRSDQFGDADLREVVDHPLFAELPREVETAVEALNSGTPFVLSRPRAPLSRAVQDLADRLLSETALAGAATTGAGNSGGESSSGGL